MHGKKASNWHLIVCKGHSLRRSMRSVIHQPSAIEMFWPLRNLGATTRTGSAIKNSWVWLHPRKLSRLKCDHVWYQWYHINNRFQGCNCHIRLALPLASNDWVHMTTAYQLLHVERGSVWKRWVSHQRWGHLEGHTKKNRTTRCFLVTDFLDIHKQKLLKNRSDGAQHFSPEAKIARNHSLCFSSRNHPRMSSMKTVPAQIPRRR